MKCVVVWGLCFITLFHPVLSYSQRNRQKLSLFAMNIGFSGLTTGIGRAINKSKKDKLFPALWTGFKYGCLGGTIAFAGKQVAYWMDQSEHLAWGWPSKIVHSYGVSIMENCASYKPLFTSIRFPVGFLMADLSFDDGFDGHVKLMPASLAAFIVSASKAKFDPVKTLETGTPFFEYYSDPTKDKVAAYSHSNTISMNTAYLGNKITGGAAHELVHNLQLREYYIFNTYWMRTNWVKSIDNSGSSGAIFLRDYIYPDFPYMNLAYELSKQLSHSYYSNPFELEAQHIALNQYIKK